MPPIHTQDEFRHSFLSTLSRQISVAFRSVICQYPSALVDSRTFFSSLVNAEDGLPNLCHVLLGPDAVTVHWRPLSCRDEAFPLVATDSVWVEAKDGSQFTYGQQFTPRDIRLWLVT